MLDTCPQALTGCTSGQIHFSSRAQHNQISPIREEPTFYLEFLQAMSNGQAPKSATTSWLLRRADQAVIAGLCLFAVVALACYLIIQGGLHGRLIEIEHAQPVAAEFKVDVNTADWPEVTRRKDH